MKCDGCLPKFTLEFPPCFVQHSGVRSQRNPGNIAEFHYLAHRVKPSHLDGIEFTYTHQLSAKKSITSNFILSHNKPSGFRLGGVYTTHINGGIMVSKSNHRFRGWRIKKKKKNSCKSVCNIAK